MWEIAAAEQFIRGGIVIFDGGDGARDGAHFTGANLAAPSYSIEYPASPRELSLTEELARDHQALNFAGAFADGAELDVAIDTFRPG